MQLRYSYRLNPSPAQRTALARAFGCARVVFNDALATRKAAFEAGQAYVPDAELSARLTASKETPERAWLGEVSAVVLQQALADLNAAQARRRVPASGRDRRRARAAARLPVRRRIRDRARPHPGRA